MRVAVVANRIARLEGEGRVMLEIARSLHDRGHIVDAFSTQCPDELTNLEGVTFHPVRGLPGPDMIAHFTFALAATRALRRGNYDVVCTMGPCAFTRTPVAYYVAFAQAGWRASWSQIGKPDLYRRLHAWTAGLLERRAVPRASALMPTSIALIEQLGPLISVDTIVEVVYGGVDAKEFPPAGPQDRADARHQLGVKEETFVVLMVGEYSTGRKGLSLLIEALKDEPSTLIVVKGAGPRARTEADLARRGLARRVMFIEPGVGVASVMAAADVVVVPSIYEPFSLVALEAVASGRPLVISSRAGASELVSSVAKVFDPLDTESLRRAIMEVKDHPADRDLIDAGIAIAALNSWRRVGERSVDVIEKLASEHRVGQ